MPSSPARSSELLKREVRALAFDQYGTIVDMQKGLTEAATPFLEAKGWRGKPDSFVTWWRRTHFENSMIDALCDRGHTSYREIGQRAVSYVMDRCGIAHTQDEVRRLVSEIEKLKPFPDVVAALGKLRVAGYKLKAEAALDDEEAKKQVLGVMDLSLTKFLQETFPACEVTISPATVLHGASVK